MFVAGETTLASLYLPLDQLCAVRRTHCRRCDSHAASLSNLFRVDTSQDVHVCQDLAHVRQIRDPAAQSHHGSKDSGWC